MRDGDLLIVGAGAAGMAAATRARRTDPDRSITVLEAGPWAAVAACGLPYFLGGEVGAFECLVGSPPERLDVRVGHRVEEVDLAGRRVRVRDMASGRTFPMGWNRLLVAPGSRPRLPAIPGIQAPNVFCLRTAQDALALRHHLDRQAPSRALVLGGGALGLELAEAMRLRGLAVVLVEERPGLFGPLREPLQARLREELARVAVDVRCPASVEFLEGGVSGPATRAVLSDGANFPVDLVLVAAGVEPVRLHGLESLCRGASGALVVDRRGETSSTGVFAAGDCVEVEHRVTGRRTWLPLAGPASRLGRVAGENMAGGHARYEGAMGSKALRVFCLEAGCTGLDEDQAREAGFQVRTLEVVTGSRPGYFPGSAPISMSFLADERTGRLLGAQLVGPPGSAARLDAAATALEAGLTWSDLERLDLPYTPPLAALTAPLPLAGRLATRA